MVNLARLVTGIHRLHSLLLKAKLVRKVTKITVFQIDGAIYVGFHVPMS